MSLLTSVDSGSVGTKYYIENVGGNGAQPSNNVPCIKAGSTNGAIRVGNPVNGLVLVGGSGDDLGAGLRGGYDDTTGGASVTLGSSTASTTNIVLTDGVVTVSGDMVLSGINSDLSVGGNILLNGVSAGKSISGYYNATIVSASYPDGADTVLATPVGLTSGWYIYSTAAAAGSQAEECVSTLVYYNGTIFSIGGSILSAAGAGTFGFKVADNRTSMRLHNATGAAQTVAVFIAKLLN